MCYNNRMIPGNNNLTLFGGGAGHVRVVVASVESVFRVGPATTTFIDFAVILYVTGAVVSYYTRAVYL